MSQVQDCMQALAVKKEQQCCAGPNVHVVHCTNRYNSPQDFYTMTSTQ